MPASLFQPVITTSRSPLVECDYNLHKSNSTYFADLDIARSHLLCCLFAKFIDTLRAPSQPDRAKGAFSFHLGAVTCHFKKAIRPYQAYDMWTRVLTWDEKWMYLITHIVDGKKVKPMGYSLQPWKKPSSNKPPENDNNAQPHPAIFATSIAKYVFKRGRVTIPPETILRSASLLPVGPIENAPAQSSSVDSAYGGSNSLPSSPAKTHRFAVTPTDFESQPKSLHADWESVENTRARGMKIAKLLAGLDDAHMEFTGPLGSALGHY